jgi:LPXTG-motif cell wall-anchored protein
VTLKISYKDNLRNAQEFVATGNAVVAAQQQATNATSGGRAQNSAGGSLLMMMIIIGAAIAVAAFFVVRKKRRANAKKKLDAPNNGPDRRKNIEDILENPVNDAATKEDLPK